MDHVEKNYIALFQSKSAWPTMHTTIP